MKVGIFAKTHRGDVAETLLSVIHWLLERDCQVQVDERVVEKFDLSPELARPGVEIPETADVIVVFGGDGTLLATARLVGHNRAPILGINLGSLGFLTEITLNEVTSALEKVLAGDYQVSRRYLLAVELARRDGGVERFKALNDAVINKAALARIISLDTYSGPDFIATFQADGLIIATPTGSTAYSLSAGGPIVFPTSNLMLLTPICPHTLTNRPLIIPSDSEVKVVLRSGDDVMLTLDGQIGREMEEGDTLACTISNDFIELIQPVNKSFFDILREKLKWAERFRRP